MYPWTVSAHFLPYKTEGSKIHDTIEIQFAKNVDQGKVV
jgi:hypothetical protein